MSSRWDLYCRTCEVSAGLEVQYGAEVLADLWAARAAFRHLAFHKQYDVMLDTARGQIYVPVKWVATHGEHDVLPRNEYGDFAKACNKVVECPTCGKHTYQPPRCKAARNHEGPCQPPWVDSK